MTDNMCAPFLMMKLEGNMDAIQVTSGIYVNYILKNNLFNK